MSLVALITVVAMTAGVVAWSVVRASDDSRPASADALVVFAGESARTRLTLELSDDLESSGIAPVVVFSHGLDEPAIRDHCGQLHPVEVLCPTPEPSNTRGEARMFAAIAAERGWRSLVAVTGDYHLARSRTLLTRCLDNTTDDTTDDTNTDVAFITVDWDAVPMSVYRHETAALWHARFIDRSC